MYEFNRKRHWKGGAWRSFGVTPHFAPKLFRSHGIICVKGVFQQMFYLTSVLFIAFRRLSEGGGGGSERKKRLLVWPGDVDIFRVPL